MLLLVIILATLWIILHNTPGEYIYLYQHPFHRFTRLLHILYKLAPLGIVHRRYIYRYVYSDTEVNYFCSGYFMTICKYMSDAGIADSYIQLRNNTFNTAYIDKPWRTVVYTHNCKFAFPQSTWFKCERVMFIDVYAKNANDIADALEDMDIKTRDFRLKESVPEDFASYFS